MKIKVISRNPDDYLRATKRDIHKREIIFLLIYSHISYYKLPAAGCIEQVIV